MRPLLKAIIIAAVATGVVVPAGYYSFSVFHNGSIALPQLVPGNSTIVLRSDYNDTPLYTYNSSNNYGIVLGVSMTAFSSQLSSASNSSSGNQTKLVPVLYNTYRGYNIYSISNVNISGLIPTGFNTSSIGYNFTLNATQFLENDTVYVADLSGVVSLGSYPAVQYSLNAYLNGNNFQAYASSHFNTSSNVSIYFNSASLPVKQAVANIFYMKSTFTLEMSNQTNAIQLSKGLSALNLIATNFSVSSTIDNNWVNGTITVGIGNYYLIEDLLAQLPSSNYTQLISGLKP